MESVVEIGIFRNTFEKLKKEKGALAVSEKYREIEFEKDKIPLEFWKKIETYFDKDIYGVDKEKVRIVLFREQGDMEMLEDFSLIR